MRFRNARSGVDNATSTVELCRLQRSRLDNGRERFHHSNNPIVIQRRSGSRRDGTRTRSSCSTRTAAVVGAAPTRVNPARDPPAAVGALALVRNGTHSADYIARAV